MSPASVAWKKPRRQAFFCARGEMHEPGRKLIPWNKKAALGRHSIA
jgi:hypothetical protein